MPLIATLATAFAVAFAFGFIATRLKLPPIVGYLVAGVVIGPFTPGYSADRDLALQLAEVGIILLMFGVGLHFSLRDLMAVRHVALPGAICQIAVATAAGAGVAMSWGWPLHAGLMLGLALSVASTVVLLRTMTELRMLDSLNGRIAVGWLIVEDLVMVLALVLLPAFGTAFGSGQGADGSPGGALWATLALTIGKVGLFIVVMMLLGKRVLPWLLREIARTGSRELFTLSVLGVALGIAYGSSELFGVSLALGAFFAGVVISESDVSHRAAAEAMPLQDAFAVLFFVSVGMLFDPRILIEQPVQVAGAVLIVVGGKSIAACGIVLALNYPLGTALTVSASLAQVGEFSFILAALGVSQGLLPDEGRDLILAAALISITINPLLFHLLEPVRGWLRRNPKVGRRLERANAALRTTDVDPEHKSTGHAVVVGHGRVGEKVAEALKHQGLPFVVIDHNRRIVERLRSNDIPSIYGDAAMPGILENARIEQARLLVVTAPDAQQARQITELARELNAGIDAVVRARNERELAWLDAHGVGLAIMAERELAASMARYALRCFDVAPDVARSEAVQLQRDAVAGVAVHDLDATQENPAEDIIGDAVDEAARRGGRNPPP